MSENELTGKNVAFLVDNEGVEQVELTEPWKAVEQAGGSPHLIAPDSGTVQAFDHLDKADTFDVNVILAEADVADFDALVQVVDGPLLLGRALAALLVRLVAVGVGDPRRLLLARALVAQGLVLLGVLDARTRALLR